MRKLMHFINNAYTAGTSSDYFELVSPVNGQVYALSPEAGQSDIDAAYDAAHRAFHAWKKSTPSQRQLALLQLAEAIETNADNIIAVQSQETGQLQHFIRQEEIIASCDALRFFAGAARCIEGKNSTEYLSGMNSVIRREPLGVVGQVTPWNYPFMMAVWKIAPALAAGNTVVLKPSDTTPQSTLLLAELAAPFFPVGAINVLLGKAQTGSMVISSPRAALVSITGSVRAGVQVATSAAENLTRTHLELGGKAPVIVFEDTDIPEAVKKICIAGFFNAGQDCTAATRLIVQDTIYPQFLDAMKTEIAQIRFGTPEDSQALYGALNNSRQRDHIQGFIERLPAYARIETGGNLGEGPGFYFEPTLISGIHQHDEVIQQEIFGPVMTIQSFTTADEAIVMANDVEFGLAASVWTQDLRLAHKVSHDLEFGTVWVNNHIPLCAEMPHGGFKKSGYGKDLSAYSLEEYTRIKHIMTDIS